MQTYQNTKPTDIAWLGEVPDHWELRKAKYLFSKMERAVRSDDEIVTCFRNGEVTLRSNRRTEGFTNALKEHGYQGVRKGDLVIHAMDAFAGAIGVSDADGKSTPVYSVCTPRLNNQVNVYFYAYFLRNLALSGFIQSLAKGIRERSTDFRFSDFAQLELPLPPLSEQTAIANFLDKKTAQIKEAIALKSEQIDKLKEYRQTLINQTVTQGLNPNALMKNSGVEWLGEVPSHWEVKKLKYFGFVYAGINGKSGDDFSKDIQENQNFKPFIPFTNICNNSIIDNLNYQYVKVSKYETQNKVLNGDVLFLMSSETLEDIAKSSLYLGQDDELYLNSFCKAFRVTKKENLNPKFLNYLLLSQACRNYFSTVARGFTRINLKQEYVNNLNTPIPPLSEQIAIANFLDDKTAQIDTAIRQYQAEIDKLKEYQQSLVNEVVTGKVRVKQD